MSTSERNRGTAALLCLLLALPGCVEVALSESFEDFDYEPVSAPPPRQQEFGSIWPGHSPSGSFLFFDQKARGVGDLVTVQVQDRMSAEGQAVTDLEKNSSLGASLSSDIGFQQFVTMPIEWVFRVLGISNPGVPVVPGVETNIIESNVSDTFAGEGSTRRSGRFSAVVTCQVLNVLPGNVFHVRGRRAIVVNHEVQYLTVEGLVRAQDIDIDNVVVSDNLANARITLDGLGVIDDKQRPGWMTRVFSWLYPF